MGKLYFPDCIIHIIHTYIPDITTEEINNINYINYINKLEDQLIDQYSESQTWYQYIVEQYQSIQQQIQQQDIEEQLTWEYEMAEIRWANTIEKIRNYMITNRNMIIENVNHNISESISGLILNQRNKKDYPPYLQPYVYEDGLNEKLCVKIVIKNIDINSNCIDQIMQKVYTGPNEKDEFKEIEDTKTDEQYKLNNEELSTNPDAFDIEIILAAYQKMFDTHHNIETIKPYMNQVKIYTVNKVHYAIFSVEIGDPNSAPENIVPVIQFIKQYNELINQEYEQSDSNKINYILRAFGKDVEIRLFGLQSTTLHISGIPETYKNDTRNNKKLAHVLSTIMNLDVDHNHIERPVGKLVNIETNQFLPAPYCYVYIPHIITQKDCDHYNEQIPSTFVKLQISLSSFHRIIKNGKIWNNIPIKKIKRSGDNSPIDQPSKYVYMEKGTYLLKEIQDINKFQKKVNENEQNSMMIKDKRIQNADESKYAANITKIFTNSGYCKIYRTSHEIWFHKDDITNIKDKEWKNLTVGTRIKCNIINQRNKLKAVNIEVQKANKQQIPKYIHPNKLNVKINGNSQMVKEYTNRTNVNQNQNQNVSDKISVYQNKCFVTKQNKVKDTKYQLQKPTISNLKHTTNTDATNNKSTINTTKTVIINAKSKENAPKTIMNKSKTIPKTTKNKIKNAFRTVQTASDETPIVGTAKPETNNETSKEVQNTTMTMTLFPKEYKQQKSKHKLITLQDTIVIDDDTNDVDMQEINYKKNKGTKRNLSPKSAEQIQAHLKKRKTMNNLTKSKKKKQYQSFPTSATNKIENTKTNTDCDSDLNDGDNANEESNQQQL